MAINFPTNPSIGDEFSAAGKVWTWNGSQWEGIEAAAVTPSNDFSLLVGVSGNTTYILDREYSSGVYEVSLENLDSTFDIYFLASNGDFVAYTKTATAVVPEPFDKIVVLNVNNNEIVYFKYQGSVLQPLSDGDQVSAGAFIDSISTSSLPNINDTTVINGGNFSQNVEVSFIGQNLSELAAKGVVRVSNTQLIATRPDSFSTTNSPYSVKVLNPGIPAPTAGNSHILSNSVTAGTTPSWSTSGTQYYLIDAPTTITLSASDPESSVSYSVVAGSLPQGLTLNSTTGVISGTFTGTVSEGTSTNITFRATDNGGNFIDRTLAFVANALPVWTTPAGAIKDPTINQPYSFQLQASGGTVGTSLTYSLVSGSLLTGHTLSASGLISGTSSASYATVANFTVRVTDSLGNYSERSFSTTVGGILASGGAQVTTGGYSYHKFTSNGTFTVTGAPATATFEVLSIGGGGGSSNSYNGQVNITSGAGGGGAGGVALQSVNLTPGNYAVVVGAGGGSTSSGSASQFGSLTAAIGGGRGGSSYSSVSPTSGGSGGGGGAHFDYYAGGTNQAGAGNAIAGQGYSGGSGLRSGSNPIYASGGGGGGAGGNGSNGISSTNQGAAGGIGTAAYSTWANATSSGVSGYFAGGGAGGRSGGVGGQGGGASSGGSGVANTGGGGAGTESTGGSGGSGIVIVRYAV